MVFTTQLSPPKDWQEFESLSRDLWAAIWCDRNTKKNGRSGQKQFGVDVYGRPAEGHEWAGVQCKGKRVYPQEVLTEEELLAEVEKAKKFEPKLSQWILATTAKKDAKLESVARNLTANHLKKGLFSVNIWFWEDIQDELGTYPEVAKKYYDPLFHDQDQLDRIEQLTRETRAIQKALADTPKIQIDGGLSLSGIEFRDSILTDEHHAEIEYAKRLEKQFKPSESIAFLQDLKARIWNKSNKNIRYLLLAHLGTAHYRLGNFESAAKFFIEAYQYGDSDNSTANVALGYQSIGDFSQAEKYAKKAIGKNPVHVNAHIVLLSLPKNRTSLTSAEQIIPKLLTNDSGIAHNLGWIAFSLGEIDKAVEWFERAVDNDSDDNPELKGTLGQFLLPNVWDFETDRFRSLQGEQVKDKIRRGISLLDEAWSRFAGTELEFQHSNWLINRGVGKRLLGDLDGAEKDIDAALAIEPDRPEFIKHRALIELVRHSYAKAAKLLLPIKNAAETPEAAILLADALWFDGKPDEAILELSEHLQSAEKSQHTLIVAGILIKLLTSTNRLEAAEQIFQKYFESSDISIPGLINRSRLSLARDEPSEAAALLEKAKEQLLPTTPARDISDLAFEYYDLRNFEAAAECFFHIANPDENSETTRLLLSCYYYAGLFTKALELCERLRRLHGVIPYVINAEIAIHEETGNLEAARILCREKLSVYPNDWYTKLQLAWFSYHLRDYGFVDDFLSDGIAVQEIGLEIAPKLAHLHAARNRGDEAVKLMFEIRKKFFDIPEAHIFYVNTFFEYETENSDWLICDEVSVGSAVSLKDASGNIQTYEIVDDIDADLKAYRLAVSHPLSQRLRGKKVGDSITFGEVGTAAARVEVISAIKSKYVYALHDSMENFERFFPDSSQLRRIFIGNPEIPGQFEEHSSKFFEVVTKQQERQDLISELYRQGKLTVGGFAGLTGKNSIEAWLYLINNRKINALVSSGTAEEYETSSLSLNNYPRLVLDITSLIFIFELELGDLFVRHFGKILLAQATFSLIQQYLWELRRKKSKGFHTIAKVGDQFVFSDITAEQVQKELIQYEERIEWIGENCVISPYLTGFNVPRLEKQQLRDALQIEFYDTLQIVKDSSFLLVSEDFVFRSLAKNEQGIIGSSIQSIIAFLSERNLFDKKEYDECIVLLASYSIEYVRMTADTLLIGAKRSAWSPGYPLNRMLRKVGSAKSEKFSMTKVASELLETIYLKPLNSSSKNSIVTAILVAITDNHDTDEILSMLAWNLRFNFANDSRAMNYFAQIIVYWKHARKIIPFQLSQE